MLNVKPEPSIVWQDLSLSETLPIVVSYFTDNFYLREAYELARTCQATGTPFRIEQVRNLKSWERNTNHKPTFLWRMHRMFPERAFLWVDADGRIRRNLDALTGITAPVAYHTWHRVRVLSGTVLLPPTDKRYEILTKWIELVTMYPKHTDQVCLAKTVKALGIQHHELPEEFCWIFDIAAGIRHSPLDSKPIIEHTQASRVTRTR